MYRDQIGAVMKDWKTIHGDIIDDENTRNAIFKESKQEIIKDLRIYGERGKELLDDINNFLVSDIVKEIEQKNAEKEEKVEVKAPENAENVPNELLQSNPWLSEVNKDIKYYDFNKYANSKRREGLNFDTSEKWKIFKNFNNRE